MKSLAELIDHWTKHIKFRPKLLMTFYIISIVPLMITAAFFYLTLTKSLEEEVGASMVQTTRQVGEKLTSFTQETTHLAKIIQSDKNTQVFLNWKEDTDYSYIPNLQELRNLITNITNQRTYLNEIFLVNDYGKYIFTSHETFKMDFDFINDPWYQEVVKEKDFRLLSVHEQNYGRDEPVVTFAGRLFKVSDLKETGTLLLDFDKQFFSNMIENIRVGQTGNVYIISQEGSSVTSQRGEDQDTIQHLLDLPTFDQDEGYLLTTIKGVKTLVGFSSSKVTDWKIIAVVPFHEVSGKIEQLRWVILILLCTAIIFIMILVKYLSQIITSPMRRLANYMKQVEKGDLNVRVPMDRSDEFGLLSSRFNHMLEKVQELEEVVYLSEIRETKLQLLNRDSELKALQMQINPHFLHNTLNTMKCVGEVYDVQEITDMSEGLAEMFKYSVDMEKYKPLREEIGHVKAFIKIIQVRYPNRIQFHVDIPKVLENQEVLKLIIQPLVENSIEHGLIPKESRGQVWVKAFISDSQDMILQVIDDGIGMIPERLVEIQQRLDWQIHDSQDDELLKGHVGLVNVSQRLVLNYGDKAALHIDSDKHKGTIVEIRMPMELTKEV